MDLRGPQNVGYKRENTKVTFYSLPGFDTEPAIPWAAGQTSGVAF